MIQMPGFHATAACAGPADGEGLLGGCRILRQHGEHEGVPALAAHVSKQLAMLVLLPPRTIE